MSKTITITISENDKETKCVKNSDGSYSGVSNYARFFNQSNHLWRSDSEYNLNLLRQLEVHATCMLRSRGHLFLNEVYDMLGMTRSKAGAVVGWVYDEKNPIGDNYVSFNIYEKCNQDFINGIDNCALLDFNVDGCILDRISLY